MNNNAIAGLGVFVALLTAWLVISLLSTPSVTIEKQPATSTSMVTPSYAPSETGLKGVKTQDVKTSVNILDNNVKTSVMIKQ